MLKFLRPPAPAEVADTVGEIVDRRLQVSAALRKQLNKVFPDNWSFMLGEIALYSFIILIVTGTYLTFFFNTSMADVTYHGSYGPLRGVQVSETYDSTMHIAFDVRGGLFIRQIHHWAALMFLSSMLVHMCRIFFTGAYRKPREVNWVIGLSMLVLATVEGFAGYSLPDDLLSGTGLRIADAIILSIPVVGTWLSFTIFDGAFPGTAIIGRLYIAHVLLIPAILAALIGAHLIIIVRQKHTEFPSQGRTEETVSGDRLYPQYAAKSGGFFFLVFATLAALGGLAQINPIWLYGPYEPAYVSAGSQPDWYMGFLEGALRLCPPISFHPFHHTVSTVFWPTVALPTVLLLILLSYPFLEARVTRDHEIHNLLQRPRDAPIRTSLGMAMIAFYVVLFLGGGDDLLASTFHISLNTMVWAGRVGVFVVPLLAFGVTYWMCVGLQEHDRDVLEDGIESGILIRRPNGAYAEIHQHLGPVDDHDQGILVYAGAPVPKRVNQVVPIPERRPGGFFRPYHPPRADDPTAADPTANGHLPGTTSERRDRGRHRRVGASSAGPDDGGTRSQDRR